MKITYIHHSSFLVEMERVYLLFDYTEGAMPVLAPEKELIVFASHRHGDHFAPMIFDLEENHGNIRFLLSSDIWKKRVPEGSVAHTDFIKPGEVLNVSSKEELRVTAFESTDEGVAFLVECEGETIYHGGDLNNWVWDGEPEDWNRNMCKKYRDELEKIAGNHIDVAFLPLDPRQEEHFYLGIDDFMKTVGATTVYPMHCWGNFSVIDKLKQLPCSEGYRNQIVDISRDGQTFMS